MALDGRIRPVNGVLPAVLAAKRRGWPAVVVPVGNLAEASLVDGIEVLGARTLRLLQQWLQTGTGLEARVDGSPRRTTQSPISPTSSGRPGPLRR